MPDPTLSRCPRCDRPYPSELLSERWAAIDDDLRDPLGFKSTQGRLCWSSVTQACTGEPTDWRRRALAAEAARDELIEAVLAVHREDDAERTAEVAAKPVGGA